MPEARQTLEEAAAVTADRAKKEIGGGDGPEPIRYGDWEVKGQTTDF